MHEIGILDFSIHAVSLLALFAVDFVFTLITQHTRLKWGWSWLVVLVACIELQRNMRRILPLSLGKMFVNALLKLAPLSCFVMSRLHPLHLDIFGFEANVGMKVELSYVHMH